MKCHVTKAREAPARTYHPTIPVASCSFWRDTPTRIAPHLRKQLQANLLAACFSLRAVIISTDAVPLPLSPLLQFPSQNQDNTHRLFSAHTIIMSLSSKLSITDVDLKGKRVLIRVSKRNLSPLLLNPTIPC